MKFQFGNIPMVPSMNNAYPSNRFGRRFKSKEYRNWEASFAMWKFLNRVALHEAILNLQGRKDLKLSVVCSYTFRLERVLSKQGHNKKLDLDNRAKPLLDAMTQAIGIDDSSIWKLTLYKLIGVQDRCEVELCDELEPGK